MVGEFTLPHLEFYCEETRRLERALIRIYKILEVSKPDIWKYEFMKILPAENPEDSRILLERNETKFFERLEIPVKYLWMSKEIVEKEILE